MVHEQGKEAPGPRVGSFFDKEIGMKTRKVAFIMLGSFLLLSACGKKADTAANAVAQETVVTETKAPPAVRIPGENTRWTTIIDHYEYPYEDTIDPSKNGYEYGDYIEMVGNKTGEIYSRYGTPVYNESSRNRTNDYILLNTHDENFVVCDMEMGYLYQYDFTREDGSIVSKTMNYNPQTGTLFCQDDCEIDTVLKNMLKDEVPTGYVIDSFNTATDDLMLNAAFDDNLYVIGEYSPDAPEPILDFIAAVNTDPESSLLYAGDKPENILFSIVFSLDPRFFDLDQPAKDFKYVYNPEYFKEKIDLVLSGYGTPVRWHDNKDQVETAKDIRITRTYAINTYDDITISWETHPEEVETPVFGERIH